MVPTALSFLQRGAHTSFLAREVLIAMVKKFQQA